MNDSHLKMVEMQQRLAHNVEAESHAFHTFMTSALRRVSPCRCLQHAIKSHGLSKRLWKVPEIPDSCVRPTHH